MAKCPKCGKAFTRVRGEPVQIVDANESSKAVMFSCVLCGHVLGVQQADPDVLKALEKLKNR